MILEVAMFATLHAGYTKVKVSFAASATVVIVSSDCVVAIAAAAGKIGSAVDGEHLQWHSIALPLYNRIGCIFP